MFNHSRPTPEKLREDIKNLLKRNLLFRNPEVLKLKLIKQNKMFLIAYQAIRANVSSDISVSAINTSKKCKNNLTTMSQFL